MIHLNVCHPATGEPGWDRMEIYMNSRSLIDGRPVLRILLEDNSWHDWKSSSDGKSTFYRPHGETSGNWTDSSVMTNEQVLDRKSTVTSSYQIGYFDKGQFWANAVVGDLFEAIEKKKWADKHFQMENHIVKVTSGVAYTEVKFEEKKQVDPV